MLLRLISGNGYNMKRGKIRRKKREEGGAGLKKSVLYLKAKLEERGQHVPSIYAM